MIVESPLMLEQVAKKEVVPGRATSFFGVRNEAVRDSRSADSFVIVEVRGIMGAASGSYKIAYVPGSSLKYYLDVLKLKNAAAKSAVYDYSNLEHGRCRLTYVPSSGARIVLGPSSYGPALQWQRSNSDAGQLMKNMGNGAREFDVRL